LTNPSTLVREEPVQQGSLEGSWGCRCPATPRSRAERAGEHVSPTGTMVSLAKRAVMPRASAPLPSRVRMPGDGILGGSVLRCCPPLHEHAWCVPVPRHCGTHTPWIKRPTLWSLSQIPPDLVIDRWASDGESGSHRPFLFRYDVWTMFVARSARK
jgi:hypothetical protein